MRHNPLCVIIPQSSILLTIPVAFMLVSPCRNYFTKILSAFVGRIYCGNDISFITFSRIPASRTSFQQQAEFARIAVLCINFDIFINFFNVFSQFPFTNINFSCIISVYFMNPSRTAAAATSSRIFRTRGGQRK